MIQQDEFHAYLGIKPWPRLNVFCEKVTDITARSTNGWIIASHCYNIVAQQRANEYSRSVSAESEKRQYEHIHPS